MKITLNHIFILQRLKNPEDSCNDISYEILEFLQNQKLIKFIYADDGNSLIWKTVTGEGEKLLLDWRDNNQKLFSTIKSLRIRDEIIFNSIPMEKTWIKMYVIPNLKELIITVIGGIILAYILKKFGLN